MTGLMGKFSSYTVKPFEGPNYDKNSQKSPGGTTPCVICGRPMKDPWPHTAVVINGGSDWGDENSDQNDPGYMGAWPVGSDCHKRYVKKD